MASCPEAMGEEFWWFLEKAVSWDSNLGKVSWDLNLGEGSPAGANGMRCAFIGSDRTVSIVKIVSLSPRVKKLKFKKS